MPEKNETFLSQFLQHTAIYESPGSFWKWGCYASIAAILRDSCWLPQGERKLYSNIYVLLLAESSGHRKGPPIDLSETFVVKLNNTKVISGRSSVQAILDELARAETDHKTGKVLKPGSAIFYAPEMSAGIVADPDALKILTDIYDYKTNPYKSRLRTGPCFNLDRIVFSLFAGSNEAMLKGLFGTAEIQGGFLARTCLITPNEFRSPNSLMRLDREERTKSLTKVYDKFVSIGELKGEFKLEEDAIVEYEKWYEPFKRSYHTKKETSGVIGRMHTTVIKLAMILTANNLRLNVCKCDMEEAINECLGLLPNYSIFTMGQGPGDLSKVGSTVLTELMTKPQYLQSRKELIRKYWSAGVTHDILDKLIINFETAGMIRQIQSKEGLFIQLTDSCLETLGVKEKKAE